jgi:23S rRNA (cytosine1962-C5)-methyltransferase
VVSAEPLFILLTAYAVKASSLTLGTALSELMTGLEGSTRIGELVLKEKSKERRISTAVFALWTGKTLPEIHVGNEIRGNV